GPSDPSLGRWAPFELEIGPWGIGHRRPSAEPRPRKAVPPPPAPVRTTSPLPAAPAPVPPAPVDALDAARAALAAGEVATALCRAADAGGPDGEALQLRALGPLDAAARITAC